MCSAADWEGSEVVVGCTDHALYVLDVDKGRVKRKLHNARNGHAECAFWLALRWNLRALAGG